MYVSWGMLVKHLSVNSSQRDESYPLPPLLAIIETS